MKFLYLAAFLFVGQCVFSQYTLILKNKEKIRFESFTIWSDTTLTIRKNQRYFFYQGFGKTDSIKTGLIEAITADPINPMAELSPASMKIILAMYHGDCDKENTGDLVIRNTLNEAFQVKFIKPKHVKRRLRKFSVGFMQHESTYNFPAGEYSYTLTYLKNGKIYKRGTITVPKCQSAALVIE